MTAPARLQLLLLALAACTSDVPAEGDSRIAVLPEAAAAGLLLQCSRSEPSAAEGTWRPTLAEIAALERSLPAALAAAPEARSEDFSNLPSRWRRQYVGIVRGGRRFVYGNFLPGPPSVGEEHWRTEPVVVCDGGPPYFGVEFDARSGRITHLAFNGSA